MDTESSPTTVYLRRNIEEVPNVDPDGQEAEGTHWQYEEAELSVEEYREYLVDITLEDQQSQIDYIAMMCDIEL